MMKLKTLTNLEKERGDVMSLKADEFVYETVSYRIDLGTANGWQETPELFLKHNENCGTEQVTTIFHGAPGDSTQEVVRSYPVTRKNLGRCHNEYYCKECGIVYRVDSSG